ncbi:hypothetical protein BJV82DRAFT_664624 [Fennellomyces sp. T-0311]|nr:hypothetical protein BJV82DRAFT_664624 [Fennellomyces sp. T-0311]
MLTSIGLEYNAHHNPNDHYQEAFNLTFEAFDNTNYTETIENSTYGIEELVNKQVALLYFRSAAHAQVAKFDKGFQDAKTIIQLAPTQALGYLRVGELLSMYGNQNRAIQVYEKGLAMVGDHKELLEQRSEEASLQQQQCVDIIARAPFEILSSIMSHFESNELVNLCTVSKTWQQRLLDIPECWSTVRMTDGLSHRFMSVRHHIVNLELNGMRANMCDELLVQIMQGGFNKLRKLCINDSVLPDSDVFYCTLSQVSNTLKELMIYVDGQSPIHYKSVLSSCPQLEKFSYIHRGLIPPQTSFGSLNSNKQSLLTSLDLDNPAFFEEADIEETLQFCSKLRSLSVTNNHRRISDLICRYCSELDTLWLGVPRRLHTFDSYQQGTKSKGLRNLSLGVSSADPVLPLINKNCDSIEAIHLFLPNGFCQLNSFASISTMTHLRTLNVVRFAADAGVAVGHILQKTPALERLSLAWCDLESAAAFTSIEQLDHLKQLEFIVVTQVCDQGIRALFRSFAAKSSLQSIKLQGCYFVDNDFLQYLPSIQSLQHIQIASATRITQAGLNEFCSRMQQHLAIRSIAFGDMAIVTDATLNTLSTVQSLRRLEVAGLSNCSPRSQLFNGKLDVVVMTHFYGPDHRLASYEPPTTYYDDDEDFFIFGSSDEDSIETR